ncbi:hypothetical protein [Streptomyces sp. 3N207]|uniref:hypothetical protein n=1 Tax=Streptomyces sp. 3N207 TaxID=3457417 RepID=UPI003FD5519B
MKRLVILLAPLLTAQLACGGTGDNGETSSPTPTETKTSPTPTETKTSPTQTSSPSPETGGRKPPIKSGDWRLESIALKDDGLGSFGGRARITYTGSDEAGGVNTFTITVFKGKKDIATLNGSLNDVSPDSTDTAELISTDSYQSGPYTYDFQPDF